MHRLVFVLLALLFSARTLGGEADAYAAGLNCFERLDFVCAIELLAAARAEEGHSTERLLDIHRMLAESHVALGEHAQAVGDFERLLELNPHYLPAAADTSPKVLGVLKEARRNLQERNPPPQLVSAPVLDVGLGGAIELLFGEDRQLLRTGPALELSLLVHLGGPWRLGGGLRYTLHAIDAGPGTVHLVGAWAALGGEWKPGMLRLGGSFGLGGAGFGIPQEEGKVGLLLPGRLYVGISLGERLFVAVQLSPGLLITFAGGVQSSFTLAAGAVLGLSL